MRLFLQGDVQHGDGVPCHVGEGVDAAFLIVSLAFLVAHEVTEQCGLVAVVTVLEVLPRVRAVLLCAEGVDFYYFFQCL